MNSRQMAIRECLLSRGDEVAVQELAGRFEVSEMTIRRDLEALARQGDVVRTHGGAMLTKAGIVEFAFMEKAEECAAEKGAIARVVAAMVEPGMTLSLDTGTTTLRVAEAIAHIPNLKVLTSSLVIASVLYARENLELVILGGMTRRGSPDLTGWITEDNLRRFRVDMAILGADGMDSAGLYTGDPGVARVSQAMISGAARAVVTADHTKLGRTAFVKFAEWDGVDCLVCDEGPGRRGHGWVDECAKQVIYAKM